MGPIALLKILIPVTLFGYAGGILFWPYGWTNPLMHPITALTSFSKFSGAEGTLLFEGTLFRHGLTPWYYIPKWILISSPLFLVISLFLATGLAKLLFKKYPASILSLWIFSACFPIAFAILTKSVVYDSWRHFLFVYPPLVLICALAWDAVWDQAASGFQKIGVGLLLLFFCAEPAMWMMRNHPHAAAYFNPAVGGLAGAQGRYETDYWGNCLRQASEQFAAEYQKSHPPGPVVIRTDGEMISSVPFLLKRLGSSFVPYAPGVNEWQYSIELARGKDPESLRNGNWPGPHAVIAITADRVPLCAVIKRPS
jgi:hypothetical protein